MNAQVRLIDNPDLVQQKLKPISVTSLIRENPNLRQPIIHGLLRRGETANIVSSAKAGKSFLAAGLAMCVAQGDDWLGHTVTKGRILIIDNELHPETLADRLRSIAMKMLIDYEKIGDRIEAVTLRGKNINLGNLEALVDVEPNRYELVILDALYRAIPDGVNENSNSDMVKLYNKLDSLASEWGAAIIVVHHTSKGGQGDKSVTDVGSGAGSISRAVDTHMTIREHENETMVVLEAKCRSWAQPEPLTLNYQWPLWSAMAVEPSVKRSSNASERKQKEKDKEADESILGLLKVRPMTVPELRGKTGMGQDRIVRSLNRIGAPARRVKSKKTGRRIERFSLPDAPPI